MLNVDAREFYNDLFFCNEKDGGSICPQGRKQPLRDQDVERGASQQHGPSRHRGLDQERGPGEAGASHLQEEHSQPPRVRTSQQETLPGGVLQFFTCSLIMIYLENAL